MAYVIRRTDKKDTYLNRAGDSWHRTQYTDGPAKGRVFHEEDRAVTCVFKLEERFPSTKGKWAIEWIEIVTTYTVSRLWDADYNETGYELDRYNRAAGSAYAGESTPAAAFHAERKKVTEELAHLQKKVNEQYILLARVDGFLNNPDAVEELRLAETDQRDQSAANVPRKEREAAYNARVEAANLEVL